ncbi:hypothetical protein [Ilumatobacter coccineus]|uniref:Uncharacterized protein n=1 Tax=Ilumatobacter coccineus (strain NBRC 103263 / KCTC 29153 / YM16-304) TaxID=1313172 RepID=A0A6C7E9Q7_ILUCY|nr:hypothetical protein [Ilumatobacter coccineus]BAN02752.1 hypothetical protein YM304_24380 [Ilumatobacter coccineus YM16-304]
MARRRRPGSRTSVVDGRARLIIPAEAFQTADDEALSFGAAKNWFASSPSFPHELSEARPAVALVVDAFAYDLHLGDVAFATDVHDGEAFRDAATAHGVDVYVAGGDIDPRRSADDDLSDAASSKLLLGARVTAYAVDRLSD